LPGQEQGELLPVGGGVVGAEHGAVAALVAHPVHMEDLLAAVRQLDDHIGPVGAHVGADLAHHVAGQAPVALALGALAEDALLGDGLLPGGYGLGGDGKLVGLADDGIGEILGVGNALHHGGGPAHGVAAGVDALEIGLEGGDALLVHGDAVPGENLALNLLAHGGDHG
ncbi:TRAP transporter small permease, partial [Dysosmobacter welbionis]